MTPFYLYIHKCHYLFAFYTNKYPHTLRLGFNESRADVQRKRKRLILHLFGENNITE